MSWTNFHSHSHFCDGTDALNTYLQQAIQQKFAAWGFSSHAPVPFPCKWTMEEEQLPQYLNEIHQLKRTFSDQIRIFAGLEVDYVPGITGPGRILSMAPELDYTIGSVHFVDHLPDGRPWEIDGRHEVFLEGLNAIFGGNIRLAIQRYYELIRQMVEEDQPDVVGHLDKIIIQNEAGQLFSGVEPWYREAVMHTLETIRDAGIIIEVNTRGIYKGLVKNPYPHQWILEEIHAMNIPITLNSDAHHPREIAGAFPETAQLLREIGFGQLQVLLEDEWEPRPFDRWGVRADNSQLMIGL